MTRSSLPPSDRHRVRLFAAAAALAVLTAGCGGGDDSTLASDDSLVTSTTTTTTVPPSTTTVATTPTTEIEVDPDVAAANTFVDAWGRGDEAAMRQVGADEPVDAAIAYGTAAGEPECSSQASGQYQCIVGASSGTRMYLLVGEPGARPGRVWWAGEYHSES